MINYSNWVVCGSDLNHFWAKTLTCLNRHLQLSFACHVDHGDTDESSMIAELSQEDRALELHLDSQ